MCLSRDDTDAVRTVHGGPCDDPVWCYDIPSVSGYVRVAVVLLYSFVLAASVVFCRNRLRNWCHSESSRRKASVDRP